MFILPNTNAYVTKRKIKEYATFDSKITIGSSFHEAWCQSGTKTAGSRTSGPWVPGAPSKFKSGTRHPS